MSTAVYSSISDGENIFFEALMWKPADGTGGDHIWDWSTSSAVRIYFAPGAGGDSALDWTTAEKNAFMAAAATWSAVSNITFQVVTDAASADLIERKEHSSFWTKSGVLGQHETISDNGIDKVRTQLYGDFNADLSDWTSAATAGSLFYRTLFHELGHAIGLAHPHDNGGGSGKFPGPSILTRLIDIFTGGSEGDLGSHELNHSLYTAMSYNRNYTFLPNGDIDLVGGSKLAGHSSTGYIATPGAFDIAVAQALYGTNTTAAAGATTYTLTDTDGSWKTIWDTSGVDIVVYDGTKNARFDLREATLDNTATGGGGLNYVSNIYAGFTVAHGVTIENVDSGWGNDRIIGNSADNRFIPGGGNDTVKGGDGVDTVVYGGACVEYKITKNADGSFTVAHNGGTKKDGVDVLYNVEKLEFANKTVDLSNPLALSSCGSLDIVFVQDLSGSFGDDIATVRSLAPSLASSLAATGASVRFAVTSFVDLPFSPYGGSGDYVYRVDSGFSSSPGSVTSAYAGLDIYYGGDYPEAQLVALNKVATGTGLAFRKDASKVAIIFTDASAHTGAPHIDVATLKASLDASGLVPLFAVTSSETSYYNSLVTQLGRGSVVTLTSDSSNITDAISQALGNLFGAPTIASTSGSDTLSGTSGIDRVYAGLGDDRVSLGAGEDFADGGTGNDSLDSGTGDDVLKGGTGNDTMIGGAGLDIMDGGLGDDTYDIDRTDDRIVERKKEGVDTVVTSVSYTLAANFENLRLVGSEAISGTGNAGDNVLDGSTNSAANKLTGLGGNDTYIVDASDVIVELAGGGIDTVATTMSMTLAGYLENLELRGSSAISGTGNGGANVLNGATNSAANVLTGLGGNDTYILGLGDTAVEASGGGIDTVKSALSIGLGDFIERAELTGTGNVNATGNALNNTLTGNDANNILNGGIGADLMIGNDGNDTYIVDNSGDIVREGYFEGTDTVLSAIDYVLGAYVEKLTLTGSAKVGTGNALDNTILGNTEDNTLRGKDGRDTLTGGAGVDRFVFDTRPTGFWNTDTITDFTVGTDLILLDNAVFAALGAAGNLRAAQFVAAAGALDGTDRIIYNAASGALLYDVDGNGSRSAVQFASIATGLSLTSDSFKIV